MLIGCVHLAPSLGTPSFPGAETALAMLDADLDALAGVDAVLLENENDKPHTLTVNHSQLAWLTRVAAHARARLAVPLGINVQRVDWEAAFAIAEAVGLDFVRQDVLVDRVRMQGELVELDAAAVMARRPRGVRVFADVHVKHAELVDPTPLAESAARAVAAGADAVLITGQHTGQPPLVDDLRAAHAGRPVYIGSGLSPENARTLAPYCDGAVVGTSLMERGRVTHARVAAMVEAWRTACASRP
jgi:membrane complex biogenesis BtpA family protein